MLSSKGARFNLGSAPDLPSPSVRLGRWDNESGASAEVACGARAEVHVGRMVNRGEVRGDALALEGEDMDNAGGDMAGVSSLDFARVRLSSGGGVDFHRAECSAERPSWVRVSRELGLESGKATCQHLLLAATGEAGIRVEEQGGIVVENGGSLRIATEEGDFKVVTWGFFDAREKNNKKITFVQLEGTVQGESGARMTAEVNSATVGGVLHSFESLSLSAGDALDVNGQVKSLGKCKLTAEWMTVSGSLAGIGQLEADPWGAMVTGRVEGVESVSLSPQLVAINSGVVSAGEATTVAAPFLLSVRGKEVRGGGHANKNSIPKLHSIFRAGERRRGGVRGPPGWRERRAREPQPGGHRVHGLRLFPPRRRHQEAGSAHLPVHDRRESRNSRR